MSDSRKGRVGLDQPRLIEALLAVNDHRLPECGDECPVRMEFVELVPRIAAEYDSPLPPRQQSWFRGDTVNETTPRTTFRGDAADRLAERDRFLSQHGTHSLRWIDGDEEFGTFGGLVCDVHEAELQLIPPVEQEAARPLPEPQPLREALKNCVSALAITVTSVEGDEPHWCNRSSGHDATCSGMLASIKQGRAALRRALPDPVDQPLTELADALERVLATEFTLQVSGHDVECDVVQTSGLPCNCGFSEARRNANTLLQRVRSQPPVPATAHEETDE